MPDETQTVAPLEGTTAVDDKMTFEPERLSYAAARRVAMFVADAVVDDVGDAPVVIAGEAFLADLGNFSALKLQIDMLSDDFRRVTSSSTPAASVIPGTTAALPAAIPAITAGLQSALGLVSLLRENVEFHGVASRIDPRSFEIAVAAELRARHIAKVIVPDLTVVRNPQADAESFRGKWQSMQEARQAAWRAAGFPAGAPAKKDAESQPEVLVQLDRRVAELQTQLDKTSEATGLTMLARLLRAEAIDRQRPRYLHCAVVSSGGHNRVSRHLFRMLFLGDGLSSMGGVVVRWALLEPDGSLGKGGVRAARRRATFPGAFGDYDDGWETLEP
jgi:hypothetical protein